MGDLSISGLLGFLDSKKRTVKKGLLDLVQNPSASVEMLDDRAKNYNANVAPVISGGLLQNRPLTEDEINQKSIDMALNFGPMGVGHIAYHGSPYKFDKFKTEAIGTGQGAQAYGHGLYFAESPEVGNQYLKEMHGKVASDISSVENKLQVAKNLYQNKANSVQVRQAAHDDMERFGKELNDVRAKFDPSLYKTDIPDEAVARMLDWDKPLSQQAPEVQKALGDLALKNQAHIGGVPIRQFIYEKTQQTGSLPSVVIGEIEKAGSLDAAIPALQRKFSGANDAAKNKLDELLSTLKQQQISIQTGVDSVRTGGDIVRGGYNPPEIAQMLQSKGIPGIRYLDGGSRSAGQGSSNFVAFDPEMIRILERNGIPTGLLPWAPNEYKGLLKP